MRKMFLWYYMFTKRLFKRYSFIILLLIIPVLLPVAKIAMGNNGSMMNIALYSRNESDASKQVMDELLSQDSIISYKIYDSEDEAYSAVRKQKADAAWIFDENFEDKAKDFGSGKSKKPFVTVVQREESVSLKLSREKLYGAVYPLVSYGIFKEYVTESLIPDKDITDEELKTYYDDAYEYDSIIKMQKLDSKEEVKPSKSFLTMPLRGLMSLVIMLCGIASVMYFLNDRKDGKFDWMPPRKRIIPAFGSSLAAVAASSVAVFIGLAASGTFTNIWIELLAMLLYIASATGFCLVLCMLFKSSGKLGAMIPFFMISMLALCPIFFRMKILPYVGNLFPPYYYLYAIYDFKYCIQMIYYCLAVYPLAILINLCYNKN